MARLNSANNAATRLSAGISDTATSLTVLDATGFPDVPFRITIHQNYPEFGEIIEVTGKSGNTFTGLLRGQEGTDASAWNANDRVDVLGTAGMYNELVSTDDSRLSDARTPTTHGNDKHSATYVTQTEINSSISTHAGNATAHHSNVNDPTSDQKAALAGTSGTPSSTNKYVTNADSRLSDARTPTSHTHTKSQITDFSHTHPYTDITGLGGAAVLNVGTAAGTVAAGDHSHSYLPLAGGTVSGNLTITGNLTVQGTETIINTATLAVADNKMVLNSDVTGIPSENAGIEIERGTSTNVGIQWNEADDTWELTKNGSTYYDILDASHAANGVTTARITNWDAAYTHSTTSHLALGETDVTAYRGDRGKTAYDHSQAAHARTDATLTEQSSTNGNIKINGVEKTVYTHPSGDGNLHVPATSTTNNTKVLKAGATAGSLSWGFVDWSELTNKPSTYTPSSHTHAATDVTSGTLSVARGGTGIASYTTGNYIRASGATTLEQRTPAQVLSDIGASASGHTHTFASLTSKPTTVSGYGITDVYTKTDADSRYLRVAAHATQTAGVTFSGGLNVAGSIAAVVDAEGGIYYNTTLDEFRGNTNGTWGKFWTELNDGASSGLDADLLDGQHGSYYATASSVSTHIGDTGNPHGVTTSQIGAEPAFTKNTAFNKNFGTAAGTVCQGNDSRLSDARTPVAHTHAATDVTSGTLAVARGGTGLSSYTVGNYIYASGATTLAQRTPAQVLSNIGAEPAFSKNTAFNKNFGTTVGTVCEGNDSRLSDARTPVAHTHATTDITSGTLGVARGGTGIASYTIGNFIYASGATTLAQRTPAQVKTDIGLANVTNDAQVKKAGDTMSGDLNMGTNDVTNVGVVQTDSVEIEAKFSIEYNSTDDSLDFVYIG